MLKMLSWLYAWCGKLRARFTKTLLKAEVERKTVHSNDGDLKNKNFSQA